jgi:hypothetical protein
VKKEKKKASDEGEVVTKKRRGEGKSMQIGGWVQAGDILVRGVPYSTSTLRRGEEGLRHRA